MADKLARLLRLRRLQRRAAERELAIAMQAVRAAETDRKEAQARITAETGAADAPAAQFAIWLPQALRVAELAAARQLAAEQQASDRRGELAAAAAAEAAAASVAEARASAQRRKQERQAQAALDDLAALRAFRPPVPG